MNIRRLTACAMLSFALMATATPGHAEGLCGAGTITSMTWNVIKKDNAETEVVSFKLDNSIRGPVSSKTTGEGVETKTLNGTPGWIRVMSKVPQRFNNFVDVVSRAYLAGTPVRVYSRGGNCYWTDDAGIDLQICTTSSDCTSIGAAG